MKFVVMENKLETVLSNCIALFWNLSLKSVTYDPTAVNLGNILLFTLGPSKVQKSAMYVLIDAPVLNSPKDCV